MEPVTITVLAAVLGAVGGGLVTAALLALRRTPSGSGARGPASARAPLPDGVREMLEVLSTSVLVLNDAEAVVQASPAAHRLGLVREGWIAVPRLARMVSEARRGARTDAQDEIEVPGEPAGPSAPGHGPAHMPAQPVVLRVRVVPLTLADPDAPGPLWVVLADDVTEARRAEQIRRDFVANVSHELKTPVGAISLLAETVADAADDPDAVRRFAGRMQRESTRLIGLVEEIIDLSRLQREERAADREPVDVDAVVAEACDRVRTAAENRRIRLVTGRPSRAWVRGDRDMLTTAVRNLIHNAVVYSPEDSSVGISAGERDGVVEVSVTDQGIGIPVAEQGRIFERFYRVDPARSRQTGGSGLGLSIVKHTAAKHGGEVTVWSRPGKGSTFALRLPAVSGPLPPPSPGSLPSGPAARPGDGPATRPVTDRTKEHAE